MPGRLRWKRVCSSILLIRQMHFETWHNSMAMRLGPGPNPRSQDCAQYGIGPKHVAAALPCALDLNMPGVSGLEVLKWIRTTPSVSTLLIVVLTSSNHDADIHRAS